MQLAMEAYAAAMVITIIQDGPRHNQVTVDRSDTFTQLLISTLARLLLADAQFDLLGG
jgi:hypothetical protein